MADEEKRIARICLVSEVTVDLGAVHGFVTAGRPTGPLRQTVGVIGIADVNSSTGFLFLEMALQAERCVALIQHLRVDRAVRRVATHATLA